MTNQGRTIALVGSGRWGKVHASNLTQLLLPEDRVLWVSHHNRGSARELIEKLPHNAPHFELADSLTEALLEHPTAALIINRLTEHFKSAESCLMSGVHTFVEKPLCLQLNEAQTLVDLAKREQRILAVGLHLLSANYLFHFKGLLVGRAISRIKVEWRDPEVEIRYGEIKRADHSIPLAHDLFPHFWSIVNVFIKTTHVDIVKVSCADDGAVSLHAHAGQIECQALFHRKADTRRRLVEISFADGGAATIDFTQEPGTIIRDGVMLPSDPLWGKSSRPLANEVKIFLEHITQGFDKSDWSQLAENSIGSVAGAESMNARLIGL